MQQQVRRRQHFLDLTCGFPTVNSILSAVAASWMNSDLCLESGSRRKLYTQADGDQADVLPHRHTGRLS